MQLKQWVIICFVVVASLETCTSTKNHLRKKKKQRRPTGTLLNMAIQQSIGLLRPKYPNMGPMPPTRPTDPNMGPMSPTRPTDPNMGPMPPTGPVDPADLSGQLGCTSGSQMLDLENMFGGLFMNDTEADEFVLTERQKMNRPSRKSTKYIHHDRRSKLIGTVTTFAAGQQDTCCKTISKVTSPETANVNGRTLYLARLNTSYQFVEQGVCGSEGASCRGTGHCVQMFKKVYVLLYDSTRDQRPPVRFSDIDVPSHCECVNVGGNF